MQFLQISRRPFSKYLTTLQLNKKNVQCFQKPKKIASRGSRTPTDWMETSHSTAKLSTRCWDTDHRNFHHMKDQVRSGNRAVCSRQLPGFPSIGGGFDVFSSKVDRQFARNGFVFKDIHECSVKTRLGGPVPFSKGPHA